MHRGCSVSAKAQLLPERTGLVHCVPHPHPTPYSLKGHSIAYSLSLVVRAKRGVLLCFGRLGLWKQALLSHFGLDLKLTAHIQGVRGQREWNLRAMRSMAQISVPDHTSFHFPFAILPSRGASLES